MKNFVIPFLIFIVLSLEVSAQEIGYFSVGSNVRPEYFNSNELNKAFGLNINFILPVRLPFLNLYYKGDMSYHRLKPYDNRCNRNNFVSDSAYAYRGFSCINHQISSLNELMICFQKTDHGSSYVQTFIGFGVMATTKYGAGSSTYGSFVFDFSNYIMWESSKFNRGIFITVLYEPLDGYFNKMNDFYFDIGVSISK